MKIALPTLVLPGAADASGAESAFAHRDASRFVYCVGRAHALMCVYLNGNALLERGMYEAAVIEAYRGERHNSGHLRRGQIDELFRSADRGVMAALGQELPSQPQVVYRGVAGEPRQRRARGWSWSSCLDVACWFAQRCACRDPAVYRATVQPNEIYYIAPDGSDSEREVLCCPRRQRRLQLDAAELKARADRYRVSITQETQKRLAKLCRDRGSLAVPDE